MKFEKYFCQSSPPPGKNPGYALVSSRLKIFLVDILSVRHFVCRHFVCSTFCLFDILSGRHFVSRHSVCTPGGVQSEKYTEWEIGPVSINDMQIPSPSKVVILDFGCKKLRKPVKPMKKLYSFWDVVQMTSNHKKNTPNGHFICSKRFTMFWNVQNQFLFFFRIFVFEMWFNMLRIKK